MRGAALWVLVCLVAAWPQPAFAQDTAPSPSASELWESYPLRDEPATDGVATPSPAPATPTARTDGPGQRAGDDGGGGAGIALVVALVVVAGAAGLGFMVLRRLRTRAPRPAPARAAPSQRHRRRRRDAPLLPARRAAAGTAPGSASAGGDVQGPLPPEPSLEWTAEIEWLRTLGRPRFHVIARSSRLHVASIASSPPIHWPPTDESSMEALAEAIRALEAALLEAGWIPAEPGTAWYAKRFAWKPVRVAASSPASAPPAALASAQAASRARPEPSSRSGR